MRTIYYSDLMKLGFTREDVGDDVFFQQNGYGYFITSLEVGTCSFSWCENTKKVSFFNECGLTETIECLDVLSEKINWCKKTSIESRISKLEVTI